MNFADIFRPKSRQLKAETECRISAVHEAIARHVARVEMNYTEGPEHVEVGWSQWIELCPGVKQVECSHLTSSQCTVMEVTMAAGSLIPRHNHPSNKETIFVIEGEIVDLVNGARFRMDGVYVIPPGQHHEIRAESDTLLNVIFHPKLK